MINLCLVVISVQFSITKERELKRILAEKQQLENSIQETNDKQKVSCWKMLINNFNRSMQQFCRKDRQKQKNVSIID